MRPFKDLLFDFTEALDIQVAERRSILFLCALYILLNGIAFYNAEASSIPVIDEVLLVEDLVGTSPKDAMPLALADGSEIAQIIVDDSTVAEHNKTVEIKEIPKNLLATVYLNTATKEELITLPGIGPAYADRILAFRKEQGSFKTIDDLLLIKGIGPSRLEKIRPLVQIAPTVE
jgi:competence protein ComEA